MSAEMPEGLSERHQADWDGPWIGKVPAETVHALRSAAILIDLGQAACDAWCLTQQDCWHDWKRDPKRKPRKRK